MQTNPFPSLGTPVSRLGFGAFGLRGVFGAFDHTEAIDAMHACWSRGVNFIDAANSYGYGECEEIIGEATIVATGGLAGLIAPVTSSIEHEEPWLTLHGLRLIWEKNQIRD